MSHRTVRRIMPLALAAGLAVLALGTGCNKESEHVPDPKGNPLKGGGPVVMNPNAVPPTPGRVMFESKRCTMCHTTNGSAARKKAPDLAKVAADPEHTREWFIEVIRDPKTHKPDATMPPHDQSKISDEDMAILVNYLMDLK